MCGKDNKTVKLKILKFFEEKTEKSKKMGALNTKQWSEVLTTGSPGSPKTNEEETGTNSSENSPVPEKVDSKLDEDDEDDRPKPRHRNLKFLDPRSVSDDVLRTPIQVEKSPESKVSENGSDNEEEEETDTSGQELLSTPMAIDKHLNKFKVFISFGTPTY